MDNASYHNKEDDKKPSTATLKADIQDWLTRQVAKWRKCCEHVYNIEDTYRQRECVIDEAVDKFIISVNNDSSSSDDDDGTGSDRRGDLTSESDSEIAEGPGIAVLRFDQC
ncbi:hypothetical protein J6590_054901 [Homalodisca vitripennis]|nr:hypothetical protein J6590_054901 [Homalodisca vitripennis]